MDPEDKEFNETLKNARHILEIHVHSAVPFKLRMTSRSSSLKAPTDPDEESRDELEHGEICCNHHQRKKEQNDLRMQIRGS